MCFFCVSTNELRVLFSVSSNLNPSLFFARIMKTGFQCSTWLWIVLILSFSSSLGFDQGLGVAVTCLLLFTTGGF